MNKIYRLKKDLPTFKAGATFELSSFNGCLYLSRDDDNRPHRGVMAYHRSTLELFPELLAEDSEWFEEVKADGCWTPTNGEGYWHITDIDGAHHAVWIGHKIDKYRLSIGGVFRTQEDAEKALEWLKARKILLDDANGFKPDLSDSDSNKQRLWYVGYTSSGDLCADYYYNWITKPGPYFATGEDAKASIEAHEKEWKIYLGVEE